MHNVTQRIHITMLNKICNFTQWTHNEYTQQWNRKSVMSHNEKYNNAIENA